MREGIPGNRSLPSVVILGLDPRIHPHGVPIAWMVGSSPTMTTERVRIGEGAGGEREMMARRNAEGTKS
jgi:hypothetical protein